MYLKSIELVGFKSFGRKSELVFTSPIAGIVGPNGSGKSNVAEAFRFVLGEQSMKSMRSRKGEDLIWGGSASMPRANRAGVRVTFDNTTRLLDIDFDEVVIERAVYRDGQNEYLLNGTVVRLKDIIRLLAGANIGGSGYQIISQGEADRILNANPRERREMVEDALGLKLFQHKKLESEKKLAETANNIEKTRSLRRELAPHINFLRAQVEKIERARDLKEELSFKLNDYLAREHAWITQEDARLLSDARAYEQEIQSLTVKVNTLRSQTSQDSAYQRQELGTKLREHEQHLAETRRHSSEIMRDLGRAEGALQVEVHVRPENSLPTETVHDFIRDVGDRIAYVEKSDDIGWVRWQLSELRDHVYTYARDIFTTKTITPDNTEAQGRVDELSLALTSSQESEAAIQQEIDALRTKMNELREAGLVSERELLNAQASLREAEARMSAVRTARAAIESQRARFEEEVREGIALIGAGVHAWQDAGIPEGALSEDRSIQDRRRRDMERLKIKIEESGIGNSNEIVNEFTQTKERDDFLAKELLDLEQSAASLRSVIVELEKTIDTHFEEGVKQINAVFHSFFTKLFAGGDASLDIEEPREPEDGDETADGSDTIHAGLTVSVSLPRKKIRGLEALSGGERALTSIALIFAMSQVNPPPFLILDETDAALDEANSRRYADMIRELGHKSQLIVITHNRATMAAAGELYGVTMGHDSVSKLLSVKLEEATKVAK